MKKNIIAVILMLALLCTLVLGGCKFEYVGNGDASTTKATPGSSTTEEPIPTDSPDADTTSFFGVDSTASVTGGINTSRLTTLPATTADSKTTTGKPSSSATTGKPSSSTTAASSDTVPSTTEAPLTDAEILNSNKYVVVGRIYTNGGIMPYKIARFNNNVAMMTELQGKDLGLIVKSTSVDFINPVLKTYTTVDKSVFEALGEDFEFDFSTAEKTLVSEGDTEEEGLMLHFKKYDDGSTDYFYNDMIVKTESYDDSGNITTIYIDEITAGASASNFYVPDDYANADLQTFLTYYH